MDATIKKEVMGEKERNVFNSDMFKISVNEVDEQKYEP